MGPDTRQATLVLTDEDLSGTEKVVLQLAHEDEPTDHVTQITQRDSRSEPHEDRVLELAEWLYLHVDEIRHLPKLRFQEGQFAPKSPSVTSRFSVRV